MLPVAVAMIGWSISSTGGAQEAAVPAPAPQCNEQQPDPRLVRGNFVVKARHAREEQQRRRAAAAEAIRIRTERYGYFPGFNPIRDRDGRFDGRFPDHHRGFDRGRGFDDRRRFEGGLHHQGGQPVRPLRPMKR